MFKDKYEQAKAHVKEHKTIYIVGGVCLFVGAAGGIAYSKHSPKVTVKSTRLFSPGDNITQLIIPALGDPGNVVQCVETGTIYASQGQAARELGVSVSDVSKHLNGKNPDIKGNHLKIIGKAGQPLAG